MMVIENVIRSVLHFLPKSICCFNLVVYKDKFWEIALGCRVEPIENACAQGPELLSAPLPEPLVLKHEYTWRPQIFMISISETWAGSVIYDHRTVFIDHSHGFRGIKELLDHLHLSFKCCFVILALFPTLFIIMYRWSLLFHRDF